MLLNCDHKPYLNVCRLCGIKIYEDCQAYKNKNMISHIVNPNNPKNDSSIKLLNPFYINKRLNLIEYICEMKNALFLQDRTLHLAIHYLDKCAQLTEQKDPKLVSAICLFLSAKIIENDTQSPGIKTMMKVSELNNEKEDFKQVECLTLKELKWDININTLYDQVQSLICYGVVFSTDYQIVNYQQQQLTPKATAIICNSITKDHPALILNVLKEPQFIEIRTQVIGMAIILYLRKINGLHPLFPIQLQSFIDIDENQNLIETYGILCNYLETTIPKKCSLKSCRSLPPVSRPPLKQIQNQILIPKLIHSKCIEIMPFRKHKQQAQQ